MWSGICKARSRRRASSFRRWHEVGRNVYLVKQLPATFGGRHRDGLCEWPRHFLSGQFPVQRRVARAYSEAIGRVLILHNSRKRPNRTRQAQRINIMNSSTTDKVKGTAKEVTGKVKEETGKAIGAVTEIDGCSSRRG